MSHFRQILKEYWGYDAFRPLQEDIIRSVSEGQDTLGLMPTGGGKSLTFQVPTMAMQGVCIVITPLISLMKDQVDNLQARGIKAAAVYSGMKRQEILVALENVILGDYKFLYVSPERLETELFRLKLRQMNVCLLVVDEAHCISQWGYDFRPSYLGIANVRQLLPDVPILALTATATPLVMRDIQYRLSFPKENVFQKSFDRSNLHYVVRMGDDKLEQLVRILQKTDGTAIVYVRSRERTKEVAGELQKLGFSADFYHAGISSEEKERKQNDWKLGDCRVIVATNAFGMGIDKPDVRLVVHLDSPNSIEEYYQEAGRAGRDEKKAYAVMLCSKSDAGKLQKRLTDEFPERDFIKQIYSKLAYFYEVADGFGSGQVFDFNIYDFCKAYKLPMLPTHNALRILSLSGYIEYLDEVDNRSRLMFLTVRDALYNLQLEADLEVLIMAVLRNYTGLFADYVNIDENALAHQTGKTRQQVYEMLKILSKLNIVSYIPQKKTPLIIYRRDRVEERLLVIPPTVYEQRKERATQRIEAMKNYFVRTDVCRSKMLLSYLGEQDATDCGRCDVCIQRRKQGNTEASFQDVRLRLKNILQDNSLSVIQLSSMLDDIPREELSSVLRELIDHHQISITHDKLRWIGQ